MSFFCLVYISCDKDYCIVGFLVRLTAFSFRNHGLICFALLLFILLQNLATVALFFPGTTPLSSAFYLFTLSLNWDGLSRQM